MNLAIIINAGCTCTTPPTSPQSGTLPVPSCALCALRITPHSGSAACRPPRPERPGGRAGLPVTGWPRGASLLPIPGAAAQPGGQRSPCRSPPVERRFFKGLAKQSSRHHGAHAQQRVRYQPATSATTVLGWPLLRRGRRAPATLCAPALPRHRGGGPARWQWLRGGVDSGWVGLGAVDARGSHTGCTAEAERTAVRWGPCYHVTLLPALRLLAAAAPFCADACGFRPVPLAVRVSPSRLCRTGGRRPRGSRRRRPRSSSRSASLPRRVSFLRRSASFSVTRTASPRCHTSPAARSCASSKRAVRLQLLARTQHPSDAGVRHDTALPAWRFAYSCVPLA